MVGDVAVYVGTTWFTFETTLQRDLAVLHTLAQLRWLTTEQVHALCFPGTGIATVRITLRALESAGWVWHAGWRIKTSSGSYLWMITSKGVQLLAYYGLIGTKQVLLDLVRPSTALEHVEWRIGLATRTLITHLVLEARRTALLAQFSVTLPLPWSRLSTNTVAPLLPDLVFSIVWSPHTLHATAWLPWMSDADPTMQVPTMHYALLFERANWRDCLSHAHENSCIVRVVPVDDKKQQDVAELSLLPNTGHTYPWVVLQHSVGRLLQQIPVPNGT